MRYFLTGFMGSGKTHWGKLLSERLGYQFIDLDAAIEEKEKRSITEIFEKEGEEYFRLTEKNMLEFLIQEYDNIVVSTGGGTPCFYNNTDRMKAAGKMIWLNTPVDVLTERLLKGKSRRPLLKHIPDEAFKNNILKKLHERRMYYDQAEIVINNEHEISVEEFLQIIRHE